MLVIGRRRLLHMAALIPFAALAQTAPKRIALVIGNTEYEYTTPLDNAVPDARKVSDQLTNLRFSVQFYPNLAKAQLIEAMTCFGQRIVELGPEVVTFFYYAGHAAQDAAEINYLIPVDAEVSTPSSLREEAFPLQRIFEDINRANNSVNVIVLDACRDWFANDASVDIQRGLHDMGRQGNMMIFMATSPGTTADDGSMEGSPFSRRLTEGLSKMADKSLSEMFDDVMGKVYVDTEGMQAPEYINGMARAARWSLGASVIAAEVLVSPAKAIVEISEFLSVLDQGRLMALTKGKTSFVESLIGRRDLLEVGGINTYLRFVYFLATILHETANLRFDVEPLKYSAGQLQTIFPTLFPDAGVARAYGGKPDKIANRIYASRMGNGDEASGDGWRYRGRGYLMITGKGNYSIIGHAIGVDLAANPDLLTDPENSLAAAIQIWNRIHASLGADNDDPAAVRRRVVGGMMGMEDFIQQVVKVKAAIPE